MRVSRIDHKETFCGERANIGRTWSCSEKRLNIVVCVKRWTYLERQPDAWNPIKPVETSLPTYVATVCCKFEFFEDHLVTVVLES